MRILYVEDDEDDIELTIRELRRLAPDWQLDVATTVAEAMEKLAAAEAAAASGEKLAYDTVLTDVRLSDGSGLQVLSYVRSRGIPAPVVVLTGNGDKDIVLTALRAGADDYVVKGSDFWSNLPAVLTAAHERYREESARRGSPLRVLYAEQNDHDADLARRHFAEHAMHIDLELVHAAEEVLGRLPQGESKTDVDVVLLDYRLLGMNALDILKEVRQKRGLDVPVIITTGQGSEDVALQAVKLGASDYVVKDDSYLLRLPQVVENAYYRAQWARERRELRTRVEMLNKILDNAPVMLCFVDPSGRLEMANREFERVLGWSQDEIREHANVFEAWYPDEEDRTRVMEFIREGSGAFQEFRTRARDGRVVTTSFANVLLSDGTSLGIGLDITEHRLLEEELRQVQKMEAIGLLASGIAHDFNNVLAAIGGNLELALMDLASDHPARISLDEIAKASRRAKSLVQRILSFARNQPQERRVLSLRTVVEESAELLRATLPAGVALVVSCADDAPDVLADPMQVQQVILNLGTNAWHAMDGRGGRIDLRLGAAEVRRGEPGRPADLPPGRYAVLSMTDTGVGMDPATVERMFEPFFTTKGPGVGTGLGLAIVRGIVQGHQGSIAVTTEVGRGTTLEVYFPAAILPTVAAPEVPSRAGRSRGQGEHVLYLDDETSLVELAIRLLGRLGYRVSGFTDPQKALDAVRAKPGGFDVVITDFNMPGVSGLEVAREIRQIRPTLPVVLTSGYVSEDLIATAAAAGVVQVVYKPSSAHELCETIHRILASRSVSRTRE